MAIIYPDILALKTEETPISWTTKDTILYALGVGIGDNPVDRNELRYVYERDLLSLPTMASVLDAGGLRAILAQAGANRAKQVHGEQAMTLHQPIPPEAKATVSTRVDKVYDKGAEKGAIVVFVTTLRDATGSPIADTYSSVFARGDGGCGGTDEQQSPARVMPDRDPDLKVDIRTTPNQALIYRLSGDYNPLHIDPDAAEAAGFPKPILHGLCTYGITCRAVLSAYAEYDAARICEHAVRFSAPVFPGETITVDLWQDGDVVSFEAGVKERGAKVIRAGRARLTET